MSDCQQCGNCCRRLIIEIGCHDIVREPRLAAVARPFRDTGGPCGFDDDGEALHDDLCHSLTRVGGCPMLGADNRCTIYPTRPNVCVGFQAGGAQCRMVRGE